jgi:hypothetical protein
MMRKKSIVMMWILLCAAPIVVNVPAVGGTGDVMFNGSFMKELSRVPAVSRDEMLEERLDSTIHFRGIVIAVDGTRRYNKNLRGIVRNDPTDKADLDMTYYVFFNSDDSRLITGRGEKIEFSGKFVTFTPVNTRRDSYILDIVFEKATAY